MNSGNEKIIIDYAPPELGDTPRKTLQSIAALLMAVQFVSIVYSVNIELGADGPKRPLLDFIAYLVSVLPSFGVVFTGGYYCLLYSRRGELLYRSKFALVLVILASFFICLAAYGWVIEDIIERNVPRYAL